MVPPYDVEVTTVPAEFDLTGRTALVTGAGSADGIGFAAARVLGSLGARVVITATTDRINQRVAELTALGISAEGIITRLETPALVDGLVDELGARGISPDILVNNAGMIATGDEWARGDLAMPESDWQATIDVNLSSPFYISRALLPAMIERGWGRIISISSVTGVQGNAGQANYAAAKAGLHGLTMTLARELAGRSITANAVAPGFITTDMTGELSEEVKQKILSVIPLGRFGSVNDIAAMVDYLASEEGGYVTGQVFSIDGGMAI
jgi:3-oxoacyl-[acyl-carrier protein] reductase